MRRFRFRLDGLLRLRSQLERAARRQLAVATADVATVEQRMEAAVRGLQDCEQQARGSGSVAMLARAMADGLVRHRHRLTNELRGAEARLDRARTDWLQSRRDHQVIEKLRQRRHQEWRQEQARDEQHELEELAQLRSGSEGSAAMATRDGGEELR